MSCSKIEILPNEPEIVQLQKELFEARYNASFYRSQYENGIIIRERMQYKHDAALVTLKKKHKEDIAELEERIKNLEAKVKLRERQLFGKKTEKGTSKSESGKKDKSQRKRGQQEGKKSPSKREYPHLPIVPEVVEISENERVTV